MNYSKVFITAFLVVLLSISFNFRANSQVTGNPTLDSLLVDPLLQSVIGDSIRNELIIAADSLLASGDSVLLDSLQAKPVGDIKTTVVYNARDSITINMSSQDVNLYGLSKIDYSPIGIEAENITVNWDKSQMSAQGVIDSTGTKIGTPVFSNGSEVYETQDIAYNFKTEKAAIKGLVTKQGEGIIHADVVFKNAKGEFYNKTTLYTTCNLAHPHYSIKARKVKIIPGKEMVTGPFNMIINDVPTPLGWAFGIFPDQQSRTSGIIVPTFGEESRRGFYLKDGGYYFAFSDYVNLELTGNIYTKGGWGINARSSYVKRYAYRGNLLFNFSKLKVEDPNTLEFDESNDFRLNWSHSPQSKGTGRFSANVNMATSSYSDNNLLGNQDDQIRTTLSSNVTYSKSFSGTPITMGISGRFNQNLKTKKADILLPDFNLNVKNLYPFKSKAGSSNKWYNKITLRYTMNATNRITNTLFINDTDSTLEINGETIPLMIENGSNGFKHVIPLSTSMTVLKHFTVSPSLNYNELWYFKKLDYAYDSETGSIEMDTLGGFSPVRTYSASVSINSRIYGTAFFNRKYGIQALRHQMTPSLSFGYNPDFGDEKFDYYQTVQSDSLGNTRTLSRYAGFVYGSPGRGKSGSIGFNLTNNLEMKVLSRKDTTGKAKKVILLRNFGLSTSYNLMADSFNLAPIGVRATTTLFQDQDLGSKATMNPLSINFSGTVDPYIYVLDSSSINETTGVETIYQRRLEQFAWNNGRGLGQFARFNIALSTGFSAKTNKKTGGNRTTSGGGSPLDDIRTDSFKEESELSQYNSNPEYYVDFKIPWSFRFSYNINYARIGYLEGRITQSLRFNGDLSLTEKWKVTYNSGYDFEQKKFTETRLNIIRDLHCWEMVLGWVPYGRYQSYNFTIKAKSSLLQDLKLSKRRNATDSFTF